jgi:hypothetical protein
MSVLSHELPVDSNVSYIFIDKSSSILKRCSVIEVPITVSKKKKNSDFHTALDSPSHLSLNQLTTLMGPNLSKCIICNRNGFK